MGIEMEVRTCKCGCGRTFKVMVGSKQEFASKTHDPNPNHVSSLPVPGRGRGRPQRYSPDNVPRTHVLDEDFVSDSSEPFEIE